MGTVERKPLRLPLRLATCLLPALLLAAATLRAATAPPPPPDPAPVVPAPPAGPVPGIPSFTIGEDLVALNIDVFIEAVWIHGLAVPFDLVPDSQHHLEYLITVPPGTPAGPGLVRILLEDGGELHFHAQFLPDGGE